MDDAKRPARLVQRDEMDGAFDILGHVDHLEVVCEGGVHGAERCRRRIEQTQEGDGHWLSRALKRKLASVSCSPIHPRSDARQSGALQRVTENNRVQRSSAGAEQEEARRWVRLTENLQVRRVPLAAAAGTEQLGHRPLGTGSARTDSWQIDPAVVRTHGQGEVGHVRSEIVVGVAVEALVGAVEEHAQLIAGSRRLERAPLRIKTRGGDEAPDTEQRRRDEERAEQRVCESEPFQGSAQHAPLPPQYSCGRRVRRCAL